jgi:hypothetical protein
MSARAPGRAREPSGPSLAVGPSFIAQSEKNPADLVLQVEDRRGLRVPNVVPSREAENEINKAAPPKLRPGA